MSAVPGLVTVVQARMGSSRLPGKVLLPLAGEPALLRQLERVSAARLAGTVVVATTTRAEDDRIVHLCRLAGYACERGHPTDLLDRHLSVAWRHGARHVAKIPSDCPLIDPAVVDRVLGFYGDTLGQYDYVSNLHPPSDPDGNDVEVMSVDALELAWRGAGRGYEREHTTPYLWDQPERFRVGNAPRPDGQDLSAAYRFTLDYPEDYELIARLYERLHPASPLFGTDEAVALLAAEPELAAINACRAGINWYRNHSGDLRTVPAAWARPAEVA